jgi:hypothetical protein
MRQTDTGPIRLSIRLLEPLDQRQIEFFDHILVKEVAATLDDAMWLPLGARRALDGSK